MRKIVLTFGLIAGGILAAMMALTFLFFKGIDFDNGEVIGYATMVAAFLMVFFGVKSYRDNVAGGRVSFGRAFRVGFLITGLASSCYVATWEVIYYNFAPDFMDKFATHAIEKKKASGATAEEVARTQKEMADFVVSYKNPLVNVGYTFLEVFPVGLVLTLVTAGVLSRKRQPAVA